VFDTFTASFSINALVLPSSVNAIEYKSELSIEVYKWKSESHNLIQVRVLRAGYANNLISETVRTINHNNIMYM